VLRTCLLRACLLTVALAASPFACARSAPAAEQPPAADGRQLFEQACARCHGADGSGGLPTVANGPRPIDLRDPAWQRSRTDDEIVSAIRNGRGAMPPFDGVVAAPDLATLARHVRSLRKVE
jgi:cytochrome c6